MAPDEFYYAVEFLLVVAVLIWFFAHPWQTFCMDVARHRHFELRNRLFMLAVNGHISFDDPLYRALREWLNNRIRWAHVNLFGDMIAMLIANGGAVPKTRTLGDEINEIDNEGLRTQLQAIYAQAIQVQLRHMLVRSPLFWAFTVLYPIFLLIDLIDGSFQRLIRWLSDLKQAADDKAEALRAFH